MSERRRRGHSCRAPLRGVGAGVLSRAITRARTADGRGGLRRIAKAPRSDDDNRTGGSAPAAPPRWNRDPARHKRPSRRLPRVPPGARRFASTTMAPRSGKRHGRCSAADSRSMPPESRRRAGERLRLAHRARVYPALTRLGEGWILFRPISGSSATPFRVVSRSSCLPAGSSSDGATRTGRLPAMATSSQVRPPTSVAAPPTS